MISINEKSKTIRYKHVFIPILRVERFKDIAELQTLQHM